MLTRSEARRLIMPRPNTTPAVPCESNVGFRLERLEEGPAPRRSAEVLAAYDTVVTMEGPPYSVVSVFCRTRNMVVCTIPMGGSSIVDIRRASSSGIELDFWTVTPRAATSVLTALTAAVTQPERQLCRAHFAFMKGTAVRDGVFGTLLTLWRAAEGAVHPQRQTATSPLRSSTPVGAASTPSTATSLFGHYNSADPARYTTQQGVGRTSWLPPASHLLSREEELDDWAVITSAPTTPRGSRAAGGGYSSATDGARTPRSRKQADVVSSSYGNAQRRYPTRGSVAAIAVDHHPSQHVPMEYLDLYHSTEEETMSMLDRCSELESTISVVQQRRTERQRRLLELTNQERAWRMAQDQQRRLGRGYGGGEDVESVHYSPPSVSSTYRADGGRAGPRNRRVSPTTTTEGGESTNGLVSPRDSDEDEEEGTDYYHSKARGRGRAQSPAPPTTNTSPSEAGIAVPSNPQRAAQFTIESYDPVTLTELPLQSDTKYCPSCGVNLIAGEPHQSYCPHRLVRCARCGEMMPYTRLSIHADRWCSATHRPGGDRSESRDDGGDGDDDDHHTGPVEAPLSRVGSSRRPSTLAQTVTRFVDDPPPAPSNPAAPLERQRSSNAFAAGGKNVVRRSIVASSTAGSLTPCPWCTKPAPPDHPKKCAERRVQCVYCREEMHLRDRNAHRYVCKVRLQVAQQGNDDAAAAGGTAIDGAQDEKTLRRMQSYKQRFEMLRKANEENGTPMTRHTSDGRWKGSHRGDD